MYLIYVFVTGSMISLINASCFELVSLRHPVCSRFDRTCIVSVLRHLHAYSFVRCYVVCGLVWSGVSCGVRLHPMHYSSHFIYLCAARHGHIQYIMLRTRIYACLCHTLYHHHLSTMHATRRMLYKLPPHSSRCCSRSMCTTLPLIRNRQAYCNKSPPMWS